MPLLDHIEALTVRNRYAELPPDFYTELSPRPLASARLLHANPEAAALLGLSPRALTQPDFLAVCAGERPLPGGRTLAAVYSGHQFGIWAGQLGDGRAHLLGEVIGPDGVSWEVQLKGAGRTPYSRMGDGRAVLRSSVREYLASEAMAGLGIPTTRALALVTSDDPVYRETVETAAIVTRLSPSFVRFGSFEHWAAQPRMLEALLEHVVAGHYPECREAPAGMPGGGTAGVAERLLTAVTERTARLIAQWQVVGFCHGVMNTDNMSILGLTLDYGPYGFMDVFQGNHVCNHSDTGGRYAWYVQPAVAHWNLQRLAASLRGLGLDEDGMGRALAVYEPAFLAAYGELLRAKFGWLRAAPEDDALIDDWWRLLHEGRADLTLAFRRLAGAPEAPASWLALFSDPPPAQAWLARYRERLAGESRPAAERAAAMDGVNPLYVLRNHLAEGAIRAAQAGDAGEIDRLLAVLRDPCTPRPGCEAYAELPPDWAAGLSVSCSS